MFYNYSITNLFKIHCIDPESDSIMDLLDNSDRFYHAEYVEKRVNSLKIPDKIKTAIADGLQEK